MNDCTEVTFVDRDKILEGFLEIVADASTWVTECALSDSDKDATVVCLAEISGAVRLVKKLLNMEKLEFVHAFDGVEDERS